MNEKIKNILENNIDYFFGSYKELEYVGIWPTRVKTMVSRFKKAVERGDPRAMYKLARVYLLSYTGETEAGVELLDRAIEYGYLIAENFKRFYNSLSSPITKALLDEVTLETEDADLLFLAGQMHMRYTYPVFNQLEYKETQYGIALMEKAADMGNIEAVHFLYEAYMGYFWQVEPDGDKSREYLKKYLSMTEDEIEAAVLEDFDRLFADMRKTRMDSRFYTVGKALSNQLPGEGGSHDDSYYDKYRPEY